MNSEKNLFEISIDWVQGEAKTLIGRSLSEYEILSVKKGLECGLLFDIDTVFKAAIEDAIELNKL